jgi:hypothetical protein
VLRCIIYNISDAADLDYIDSVLGEVWDSEYFHPAVFALENKREALGAFLSGKKQTQVRKRHFLSHLYIKCIILPRQARDKHRESTQKKCRFPSGITHREG